MRVKVVIIGEASVGKTSIMNRAVRGTYSSETKPTVGAANAVLDIHVKDQQVSLNIWDTAGQEKYRSLTTMYFNGAGLAIIVFDLTNKVSLNAVPDFLRILKDKAGEAIKYVLVGNKSDLPNRQVQLEEATEFAQTNGAEFYIETSAFTGERIDELFQRCANLVLPASNPKNLNTPVIELKHPVPQEDGDCC